MPGDNDEKIGLLGKIKTADALVTLIAGVIGLWAAWTTITLDKLSGQLSAIKEERGWSEKIFDKYSDLVTRERLSSEQRIAALNGLLTLTNLVAEDQARVRDELRKIIGDQAQFYSTALEQQSLTETGSEREKSSALAGAAAAVSGRAAAQLKQSATADAAQSVVVNASGQGSTKWGSYNVEVFWCEKSPEALTTAQGIVGLKLLDPKATGYWRPTLLRAGTNARPGYGISGNVARYGNIREQAMLNALNNEISSRGILAASTGTLKLEQAKTETRGYVSIFICP